MPKRLVGSAIAAAELAACTSRFPCPARSASAQGTKRASCSRAKPRSSSAVAKCVIAPARRRRGAAATAAAVRVASAASRVPSRPMPVSSLTWTPVPAARGCSGKRARRSPRARRPRPRARGQRHDRVPRPPGRPSRAAARRTRRRAARPPRDAVATASQLRPAGLGRRARRRHRAVAVAVGLHHRAQARRGDRRAGSVAQLRSIAPRSTVGPARARQSWRQSLVAVPSSTSTRVTMPTRRPCPHHRKSGCACAARDQPRGVVDARIGSIVIGVRGASGPRAVRGERLAQAVLECADDDSAGSAMPPRTSSKSCGRCRSASSPVTIRSASVMIPTQRPPVVDHGHAATSDRRSRIRRRTDSSVSSGGHVRTSAVHDVGDGERRHAGRGSYALSAAGSAAITSDAITPSGPCGASREARRRAGARRRRRPPACGRPAAAWREARQ